MVDITKYLEGYNKVKKNIDSQTKLIKMFKEVFNNKYIAVCLDIDKTITDNQEIDLEMLRIFGELLKINTSICFITGRGRTSSREVLQQVFNYMVNNSIDIKNITCASSNGAIFLQTEKNFLDKEYKIVNDITVEKYKYIKSLIREEYITQILKQGIVNAYQTDLIERSIKSTGDMSLRFAFLPDEIRNDDSMIFALNEVLARTDLVDELNVFKGKHKDKIIYEISIADKLKAVNYFKDIYKIPDGKIVKVGDQAKKYGNDYSMLRSIAGFSVDELDENEITILPVIDECGNQIKGTTATKKVLTQLNFGLDDR